MAQKFKLAARSPLAASILSTDTSLTVSAALADLFPVATTNTDPVPTAGKDYFKVILEDSSHNKEVVYVRTRALGAAIFTNVIRAQEGTTARAFAAGDIVGLRHTAVDLESAIDIAAAATVAGKAVLNAVDAAAQRTALAAAGVIRKQSFTASGTYTPDPDLLYCIVEIVGGGGGGGGSNATVSAAGGGGGGGYSRGIFTKAAIGASRTVTIGAGGAGGVGNATGQTGVTTSLGVLMTATGGSGGRFGQNGAGDNVGTGGASGGGTGGDLNSAGGGGTCGAINSGATFGTGGAGGASMLGGGGQSSYAGIAAPGYGGGGSGFGADTTLGGNGGAGKAGVVFVTEFCAK